jgi:hypothetical protein
MNIFVLSMNLEECARFHYDSHVVKMILEYAQILCTVVNENGGISPYKSTHKKHPCVLWAGRSLENWLWLQKLTYELNKEYQYRFSSPKPHKSAVVAGQLKAPELPSFRLTPFAQAMPEKRRVDGDAMKAYRQFYIHEKQHLLKYTKREPPAWLMILKNHKNKK